MDATRLIAMGFLLMGIAGTVAVGRNPEIRPPAGAGPDTSAPARTAPKDTTSAHLDTIAGPIDTLGAADAPTGTPAEAAQAPDPSGQTSTSPAPMDTSALSHGPGSKMSALLEKTFLGVDVLRVELRFGSETQSELLPLIRGSSYSEALAEQIAGVALRTRDAWAQITFSRHVPLKRFVRAVDASLSRAQRAGIITGANHRTVTEGLPRWFGFLDKRGFSRDDRIVYRITEAGLRTVFIGNDGRKQLDQTDPGRDPPLALLAGYFAPGSDFRNLLIRSLF